MRLLLFSYWYYPEPVLKPHDLAKELVKRGHQVTVITGFPNYPTGNIYPEYRMKIRQRQLIDNVNVIRIPFFIDRSNSGLRRIISYLSYAFSALGIGTISLKKPDIIWNYQIGLPGIILGALYRVPVVHEIQDLWPDWSQKGKMGVQGHMYKILEAEEHFVYNNADRITTISKGFKNRIIDKGIDEKKISIISNWANDQLQSPPIPDPELANIEGFANYYNIMYVGNIGTAQGLQYIINAAMLLREIKKIKFTFIGDGVERDKLEKYAKEKRLTNLQFLGSRPLEQIPEYLAHADIVLLPLRDDPAYNITIPSKTYTYLSAGKPIIVAAKGDVADLITEIGAGIICAPDNPEELAKAIQLIRNKPLKELESMGNKGLNAIQKQYNLTSLVNAYETLFKSLLGKS